MTDVVNALQRAARRHGWKEEARNNLDYFTLRFCRPEPDGRVSRVLVRVTSRIVDVQLEINGMRQQLTLPTLQRVEDALASRVPVPDDPRPLRERVVLAVLDSLGEGDPVPTIAVGQNEVRVAWAGEDEDG